MDSKQFHRRVWAMVLLLALMVATMGVTLYDLQINNGDELRRKTQQKIAESQTVPAARGEKFTASIPDTSISNMDRVRADMPKLAATPRASPAIRETTPSSPVSRNSSRDTCPWLRPSSR